MTAALAVAVLAAFVALAAVTTLRYARRELLHPVVLVNGIMVRGELDNIEEHFGREWFKRTIPR